MMQFESEELELTDVSGSRRETLCSFIFSQTPDILRKQASKNPADLTMLIQGIFQGSPISEPAGLQRRLQVFVHTIKLLQSTEISNKVATEMVGFLMFEVW